MKKASFSKISRKRFVFTAAVLGIAGLAAGCGKQAYVVTGTQSAAQAPGSFTVPAKVDVLLVQDDTGSSIPLYSNISAQLQTFLTNIQTQGWDYHLATIPLTTYRAVQQVQASQYDPNWGSQWLAPYPGAVMSAIETVSAAAFRTPSEYSDFLTSGQVSSQDNGSEPGLANVAQMLADSSMTSTGFMRPDALLAVVLLSTGDDTSGRNYCSGPYAQTDGYAASCDLIGIAMNGTNPSIPCGEAGANPVPYCNNYTSSLTTYERAIAGAKGYGNSAMIKFYSVVSAEHQVTGENCGATNGPGTGTNAFAGTRYEATAGYLGGQSYDICTVPIPNALQGIAANLTNTQLYLYTSYLFMAQQPNPATITVYRNPGGNTANAVLIPQDPNNGWSFAGDVNNVFTTAIGSPTATPTLNQGSGWAVQLHGSGILSGSDTATVNFTPAGATNSAQ